MIGRSGFHGLLRNLRVSPWTRRSLTESLLLSRLPPPAGRTVRIRSRATLSPSASLACRAWEATVGSTLPRKDDVR